MPIYTRPHDGSLTGTSSIDFRSAKGQPLTAYGAKGNMTQAAEQQYTLTGIPPLPFLAKGTPLTSYSIIGNEQQTGTPTPDAQIVPEETGDRTGNLFDEIYPSIATSVKYIPLYVGNGTYTLSSSIPNGGTGSAPAANLFLLSGNVSSGASSNTNGVWSENPITQSAIDGYITIAYRNNYGLNPENYDTMLNTGSTALPYEPHGVKIPVTVAGTTYPIYLSEPIRKIGDYADVVDSSGTVTRRIRKLVLTGSEYWTIQTLNTSVYALSKPSDSAIPRETDLLISTDFVVNTTGITSAGDMFAGYSYINFNYDGTNNDLSGWKQHLSEQYANGTPVVLWYVLATPQTETVTCPTITPSAGSNTLSVGTTLAPSGVSITTIGGVAPYNPIVPAECGELVTSGEHAGQYKLTFTNAGNSYPVYAAEPLRKIGDYADELSSAGTITRRIYKWELNGTENWNINDVSGSRFFYISTAHTSVKESAHFSNFFASEDIYFNGTGLAMRVYDNAQYFSNLTAFKQFLAAQYSAGTPVTVWYVLATPTTETVTAPEIATAAGTNTFAETSTLAPSQISITGSDFYESITKIPVGDGTNEVDYVLTNDGRCVYWSGDETTLTGIPPLPFRSNGSPLTSYTITGNMQQTGTPTPDAPIEPEETGDRTAQLLDVHEWVNSNTIIEPNGLRFVISGEIVTVTGLSTANYPQSFIYGNGHTALKLEYGKTYTIGYEYTDKPDGAYVYCVIEGKYNGVWEQILKVAVRTATIEKEYTEYRCVFVCEGNNIQYSGMTVKIMLTEGSTVKSWDKYGYAIPITCGGTTQTIYLTEPIRKIGDYADTVDSSGTVTRRIRKLVLTGEENISTSANPRRFSVQIAGAESFDTRKYPLYCTHYAVIDDGRALADVPNNSIFGGAGYAYIVDSAYTTADEFKAYLAQQYASGTPVTVWYVLNTPTTESVTCPTITPAAGSNTLSIGTTLAPSGVSITGKIKEV